MELRPALIFRSGKQARAWGEIMEGLIYDPQVFSVDMREPVAPLVIEVAVKRWIQVVDKYYQLLKDQGEPVIGLWANRRFEYFKYHSTLRPVMVDLNSRGKFHIEISLLRGHGTDVAYPFVDLHHFEADNLIGEAQILITERETKRAFQENPLTSYWPATLEVNRLVSLYGLMQNIRDRS